MSARHLKTGRDGEEAARAYLESCGYVIVARNWRGGGGELDLVCRLGREIIFVEVKTRASSGRTLPIQALTPAKQQRLVRAASAYLSQNRLWETPCRFDVISVFSGSSGNQVEHCTNAFEFANIVGSRHSSWQPW